MEAYLAHPVPSVTMDQSNMADQTDLPEWLMEPQQPTPDDPRPSHVSTSLHPSSRQLVYTNLFENALEQVMGGAPLQTIIKNDQRGIQLGRFLQWIMADPTRRQRYEGACEVAAEQMAHTLNDITDAEDSLEDVQRSALRFKSRTYLMERWSPKRYGDSKRIQIDQTSTSVELTAEDLSKLSISDLKRMALEKFQQAAARGDVVEVEQEQEQQP